MRKIKLEDGTEIIKKETIKKPEVVEAYLKIKSSKTDRDTLLRYVAENSDEEKEKVEKLRRERRRLQEQIRRTKKNKEKLLSKDDGLDRIKPDYSSDENDTFDNDDLVKVRALCKREEYL